MAEETVGLDAAEFPGEELPVASSDYAESDIPFVAPGEYHNPNRDIQARQPFPDENGVFKFVVDFQENGLVPASGEPVRYGPRFYMDTLLREVKYGGTGKTSSVKRYLAAFGFSQLNVTGRDLREALKRSQALPVIVVIELEDDYRERPEGVKSKKTKFFLKDGVYVPAIRDESGKVWKARPRIARFKQVEGVKLTLD